ncbi:uncharacterized protein LOC114953596 isoform X2 [Acropora millepora]|uniref:uncharacterized protein LOC114953596 isoform X2 n=1 Tax=Acropora millepora TaxID=45264 RepID=UPI001CF1684B|nr:uncharacterized protein LOC114953596 isoform X2 [Acropora millepora]
MKWLKHDPENRKSVLPKLLECLRTGSLMKRFLELKMTQNPEKQSLSPKDWNCRKLGLLLSKFTTLPFPPMLEVRTRL